MAWGFVARAYSRVARRGVRGAACVRRGVQCSSSILERSSGIVMAHWSPWNIGISRIDVISE
jgi:hypothetical protein